MLKDEKQKCFLCTQRKQEKEKYTWIQNSALRVRITTLFILSFLILSWKTVKAYWSEEQNSLKQSQNNRWLQAKNRRSRRTSTSTPKKWISISFKSFNNFSFYNHLVRIQPEKRDDFSPFLWKVLQPKRRDISRPRTQNSGTQTI